MIDLGTVRPGETIFIPFQTFNSNDPSASVAIAAFVLADIGIYKNGNTTERASTTGVVLLDTDGIDFDGIVGIGGFSIDLSSNATADFYTNGDRFFVTVGPVTVDAAVINFLPAMFRIGYGGAILDTTISALTSQTSFTLSAGSADADAYNDSTIIVHDIASAVQIAQGFILDSTGARVITLEADPGIFTMAVGDHVSIFPRSSEVGIAKAVWDRVLTGSTHNIANSSGRRLRQAQEAGGYTLGSVYIDTVGGSAGTTSFENGVDSNQVDSITDANTIAGNVGLSKFLVAPNSSITFAATQDGQVFFGALWTLALGGQSVNNTHIIGAEITGVCTGTPHMDHCHLGVSSFAAGEFSECGLEDTITLTGAANYSFINCYHEEEGAPSTIDFGSTVGTSEVHVHGWKGNLLIRNMDTGDILHFSSAEGRLEFDSTNTAGTKNLSGNFALVDNSTGMTLNDNGLSYDRMGAPAGASLAADLVAIEGQTDDIGVAGAGLTAIPATVDWLNGGRLDLILDIIAADTTTDIPALIATAQADLDIITGTSGVVIEDASIVAASYAAGARDAAGQATDAVNEIRDAIMPTQNAAHTFKYVWVATSDHVTPVTGATTITVTRSIDGGAFAGAAGTHTEIANGVYRFAATAADMNGAEIAFRFVATGGTPGAPDDAFVFITTTGGV